MLVHSLRVSSDTDRQTTCNALRGMRAHVALQRMPCGRRGHTIGPYPALSITPSQGVHAT
jgi:hypothetical protein